MTDKECIAHMPLQGDENEISCGLNPMSIMVTLKLKILFPYIILSFHMASF